MSRTSLLVALVVGPAASAAVRLELRIPEPNVLVGEPVAAQVVFRNDGAEDVRLPMAEDRRTFVVQSDTGFLYNQALQYSDAGDGISGPGGSTILTLPSGGFYAIEVPLQQLGNRLPPGDHTVFAIYRTVGDIPGFWQGQLAARPVKVHVAWPSRGEDLTGLNIVRSERGDFGEMLMCTAPDSAYARDMHLRTSRWCFDPMWTKDAIRDQCEKCLARIATLLSACDDGMAPELHIAEARALMALDEVGQARSLAARYYDPLQHPVEAQEIAELGLMAGMQAASGAAREHWPYETTRTIYGYVTDRGGKPLRGAMGRLRGSRLPAGERATTADDSGFFSFSFLLPGDYSVSIEFGGYISSGPCAVSLDGSVSRDVSTQLEPNPEGSEHCPASGLKGAISPACRPSHAQGGRARPGTWRCGHGRAPSWRPIWLVRLPHDVELHGQRDRGTTEGVREAPPVATRDDRSIEERHGSRDLDLANGAVRPDPEQRLDAARDPRLGGDGWVDDARLGAASARLATRR